MISTETPAISAKLKRGSGPNTYQAAKAAIAHKTTTGTNQADTASAKACVGARLLCASAHQRDDLRQHCVGADCVQP